MKKAVADTSALISIALSEQLGLASESIKLVVPPAVKIEIIEMGEYDDIEGGAAKKILSFIKDKKIYLIEAKNVKNARALIDKHVDLGEAECFELAVEEKIETILMDDINAAYYLNGLAKAKKISIKISAAAIIELIKLEKLTKKQGIQALQKMIKNRQWEKGVLEYLIAKHVKEI